MRRPARGVSLVELLAVVTISGALISGTTVCLHGMFRVADRVQDDLQRQANLDRLALRLRADAHAAQQASIEPQADEPRVPQPESAGPAAADAAPATLVLAGPGARKIVYRYQPGEVLRTVMQGENVQHRDAFLVPGVGQPEWEIQSLPRPIVAMRVLPLKRLSPSSMPAPLTVEAVVGL